MKKHSTINPKTLLFMLVIIITATTVISVVVSSVQPSRAMVCEETLIVPTTTEILMADTDVLEETSEEHHDNETVYEVAYESVNIEEYVTEVVTEEEFKIPIYKMVWDGYEVHLREELQMHTYNLCVQYGIPWFYEYYLAQLFQESAWKEGIITSKGDYGIAQINIRNHAYLSSVLGIYDFADSFNSISAGMYIMQGYLNKGYTVRQAMTAYRWGEANALNHDPEGYYDRISSFTTGLCRIN